MLADQRKYAEAEQVSLQLAAYDGSSGMALNNAAWFALLHNPNAQAVARAERSCSMSQWKSSASVNTLANLYAQQGRTDDAVRALARLYELQSEVDETAWYAQARVAQDLGFDAAAKALFKKILEHDAKPSDDLRPLAREAMKKLSP